MNLFLLDPEVTHLNHGSYGACPEPVFAAYQEWQRRLERQPVAFMARDLEARLTHVREVLGREFGTHPDNLGLVSNATTAINFVARSLPPGEVLSSDHEYGMIDASWQSWGHQLVIQPLRLPVTDYVEEIWAAVTPQTQVLSLSHITSPTGLVMPIAELIRRARERGIYTVVDGAHVPGQLPLDLEAVGADFYAGNLHKWMCAPKGAAFLYARPEVQGLIKPLVTSWPGKHTPPFVDAVMNQATRDPSAFLAAADAVGFCAAHHGPEVRAQCHQLVLEGRRRLLELVATPALAGEDWLAQMAAVELPAGVDPVAMKAWLYDEKRIEVPVWEWHGRPLLRFSIQSYNRVQDVDRLLEAVGEYLRK